jgi:hypothetical protein
VFPIVSALKTVIHQEFNVTISIFNRDPAIESSPIGVISTVMVMAFCYFLSQEVYFCGSGGQGSGWPQNFVANLGRNAIK